MIKKQFKGLAVKFVSRDFLYKVLFKYARAAVTKSLKNAPDSPEFLTYEQLSALQAEAPVLPDYGYSPEALEKRGTMRAAELINTLKLLKGSKTLELGCWDGMVSCALQRRGVIASAIDFRDEGFDQRAIDAGVTMRAMDAASLDFPDNSFDAVFSFDAFEHFHDPDKTLSEIIRVLKKNGLLLIQFGPLYMSSYGLHSFRSMRVPYSSFLFKKEDMNAYCEKLDLAPVNFDQLNYWSLEQFRNLWSKYQPQLYTAQYREKPDFQHLHIIKKYSSCFKNKTDYYDNYIVSHIDAIFVKK